MATTLAASTYTVFATVLGVRYELSVTVRMGSYARFADNNQAVSPEQLAGMTAHTIATWQRVIEAVMNGSYEIAPFAGHEWPSAQAKQGVSIEESEPFVTVWNKEWNSKGLGITVHSWDNGTTALFAAYSMLQGIEKIAPYADKFGIEKLEYAPLHKAPTPTQKPSAAPKRDINDVDSFLDPENYSAAANMNAQDAQDKAPHASAKQDVGQAVSLPFRFFKRLAPNIIQLQEFVQGGGGKDKYQKSAIEATLPFHKTNVQYDDGAFVYYPITGAIQIKEGNYGKQAIIPTAKGRVYVDMEYNGQEKPEWAALSGDLHTEYGRLLNDENAQLFAPNSVLVLKVSAITKDKKGVDVQYKNYYRIYQPFRGESHIGDTGYPI